MDLLFSHSMYQVILAFEFSVGFLFIYWYQNEFKTTFKTPFILCLFAASIDIHRNINL